MPKPEYPLPGEAITSQWARQVTDFGGEKWRYVSGYALIMNALAGGSAAKLDLELTNLPANDPTVRAAELGIMIRDAVGINSWAMRLFHYGGSQAGVTQTSGVTNKGGYAGNFQVKLGGANNRWVQWDTNAAANANMRTWVYVFGYWRAEN